MSPPRRDRTQAKRLLLESARKLVVSKGFGSSTVDEVCESAGFTKGTFFHYFSNKREVILSLLDQQIELLSTLRDAPFMKFDEPIRRFNGYIDAIVGMYIHPIEDSCIVGMLSEELADTDNLIKNKCGDIFIRWTSFVESLLREIDREFPFGTSGNIHDLAVLFVTTFEGAVILGRATGSTDPLRKSLNLYRELGIL